MSIRLMTEVWKHSPYRAGGLLVHLALADAANDDGICWIGQKKLAEKARMTERQARRLLEEMVAARVVKIIGTKFGVRMYEVSPTVDRLAAPDNLSGGQTEQRDRTSATAGPDIGDSTPMNRLEPKERTALATPIRVDVEQLCTLLAESVVANGYRPPTITQRWRDSARLLIDRDKIPLEEALEVLRWSQNDDFWAPNIMAMPKFREKFDTLRGQMRRKAGTGVPGQGMVGALLKKARGEE